MKRYLCRRLVLHSEIGNLSTKNRRIPPLSFSDNQSKTVSFSSSLCDWRHGHHRDHHRDRRDLHKQRSLGLIFPRQFSSTSSKTITATAVESYDTHSDDDDDKLLVQIIERKLKDSTVEDAALIFFNHCNQKDKNFNPHFELTGILEILHDNPQASEGFIKAFQELANNATTTKFGEDNNEEDRNRNDNLRPERDHYRMVLNAWHNFQPPSAKRAQTLLDYMKDSAGIDYETESCNLVLEIWAKKENAERAQNFFDKMIRKRIPVDLVSFSHVLKSWSKSKSPLAAKRAEAMLLNMETFTNLKPSAECYLRVIECWNKSKRKGAESRIETLIELLKRRLTNDTDHCNDDNDVAILQTALWNVLQAYHKIGNAHRAEEILLDFVDDYQTNGTYPPTIEMCLSVLTTWSKSPSSRRAARAEKLLHLMEKNTAYPQPDTSCYTAVLNCIASSKKQGSAKRAEALLLRMDRKKETKSNLMSLTCVLIAWARSDNLDAPIQAERIFQEMLNRGMQPDRFVFAGLITAWGRSDNEDSIIKVEDYFQRVKGSQNSKPTVVEYTAVIQAYANYVSRNIDKSRESVQKAEALLDEMLASEDRNLRPNTLSYAAVLKTIAAARRIPDRGEHADSVLQKMYSEQVEITPYIMNLVNKCYNRKPTKK